VITKFVITGFKASGENILRTFVHQRMQYSFFLSCFSLCIQESILSGLFYTRFNWECEKNTKKDMHKIESYLMEISRKDSGILLITNEEEQQSVQNYVLSFIKFREFFIDQHYSFSCRVKAFENKVKILAFIKNLIKIIQDYNRRIAGENKDIVNFNYISKRINLVNESYGRILDGLFRRSLKILEKLYLGN
jgi:hypothetical protein